MHPRDSQPTKLWWLGGALICLTVLAPLLGAYAYTFAQANTPATGEGAVNLAVFDGPTTASPIALSQDKSVVWVVNPDDGSVTVLGNLDSTPSVLATVKNVGKEPQSIALDTGVRAYVVSPPDNSVTVIKVNSTNPFNAVVEKRITTGAEPWNVVASPDGKRIFVANSGQDTITVIRTDTQAVVGNVDLRTSLCNVGATGGDRHFQPRGLAVTADNTRLYVTRFLSFTKAGGKQGDDNGKEGVVCRLNIDTNATTIAGYTPSAAVSLASQITGFKFDSNADKIPDTDTSAYPNQMQSVVIRGNSAYLPNIAASPSKPLVFNVDTQAFVNRIDNVNATETDAHALNLHLGARKPEPGKKRLFFANPWAIAFTNQSGAGAGYVVSAGSDLLVKVNVDASGVLTFTGGVSTTTFIDLNDNKNTATSGAKAGKNPLGLVIRNIDANNNRAFVMNYVSRNVSVVNLNTDQVEAVVQTSALPPAGSADEQLQAGKEVFFSSRGHFEAPAGQTATVSLDDRLSSEGWQNCASCHFAGLTDGVIWQFNAGPRKSVALNGTWSPHNPDDQRLLNYSAIFDEVQDFELNIRNVSGPGPLAAPLNGSTFDPNHGLIISDTGNVNFAPAVVNGFAKPNAKRPQLLVRLPGSSTAWPALDAMKEWVRFAVRTPEGALTTAQLTADPDGAGPNEGNPDTTGGLPSADVSSGRRLFFKAGCQKCHGGTKWTISNKDFTSPPAGTDIFCETVVANGPPGCQTAPPAGVTPVNVQYLNRFLSDITSFNLGVAGQGNDIGGNVGAPEIATNGQLGLGKDHNLDQKGNGFNIPSLLGIVGVQPYYHNGACETLACVVGNAKHRTGNGQFADVLTNPADQAKVVAWLQTLDAATDFPIDLSVRSHDIFFDPPVLSKGQKVTVGANIQLFGTKADLTDILQDLGLTAIKVTFEADPGLAPVTLALTPSSFKQDFGQAVMTTTWDIPANTSVNLATIKVTVDSDNKVLEHREDNNAASRRRRLRTAPPDTVAPQVNGVFISDDNPFNDNDQLATSTAAKVKIQATDDVALDSYCIVRYRYKQSERLWEPRDCNNFTALPAPDSNGDFIVDTQLFDLAGVTYAFVWVKDKAGNISSTPGFDVINLASGAPVDMDRNDVRIFRFVLPAGAPLTLKFTPSTGDIDVSVFDHFRNLAQAPTRCAVSANNGTVAETVSLPGTCAADADGRFYLQVEVRAVTNSRFTIEAAQVAEVVTADVAASPESRLDLPLTPSVAGPPLRAAVDEAQDGVSASNVYLPVVSK
jgi:YVTN family beta-propeller protein